MGFITMKNHHLVETFLDFFPTTKDQLMVTVIVGLDWCFGILLVHPGLHFRGFFRNPNHRPEPTIAKPKDGVHHVRTNRYHG